MLFLNICWVLLDINAGKTGGLMCKLHTIWHYWSYNFFYSVLHFSINKKGHDLQLFLGQSSRPKILSVSSLWQIPCLISSLDRDKKNWESESLFYFVLLLTLGSCIDPLAINIQYVLFLKSCHGDFFPPNKTEF